MDKNILEWLITRTIDRVLEQLQSGYRVEQVSILLGEPLGICTTIRESGDTWTVTVGEEDLRYEHILAAQLKVGDVYCPPGWLPPGIVTGVSTYRATKSSQEVVGLAYEGNVCGKRIGTITSDQHVCVYRGNLEDAQNAWKARYGN